MEIVNLIRRSNAASRRTSVKAKKNFYEMTRSLRTQLITFCEVRNKKINIFFKPENELKLSGIKQSVYKYLRVLKSILMVIYSLLVFFEKPLHCYHRTTFYKNKDEDDNNCNDDLVYMNKDLFINVYVHRGIELLLLVMFILIQIVFIQERKTLKRFYKEYQIVQTSLMISIGICFIEIVFSLIFNFFPLINFFLRGIIIILLLRHLRTVWMNMFYLLWETRNLFFLLFCVIFCFGILGYFLFNYCYDFSTIFQSCYSLFILLTTCNFPDVMLGTFTVRSKLSLIFFILYIMINYFIIFSLLKSLYYSEYFKTYKKRAKKIVKFVSGTSSHELVNINELLELIAKINKKYSLSEEEREMILELLNENIRNEGERKHIISNLSKRASILISSSNDIFKQKIFAFFNKKIVEISINFVDLILIMLLFINNEYDNPMILIIQMVWFSVFIFEYGCYIYYFNFNLLISTELIRTVFFVINLLTFFIFLIVLIKKSELEILLLISKPLIILRSIRIILLLKQFTEFKAIFKTLNNMKSIFEGLISTLFSFFFIFTTISLFLTGGKITKDAFADSKDIPDLYTNINFNDFGSGFLSCFCLTMVNNINIISRSLSYKCNEMYKAYFATFYFISTLIILNICQTLLLEMYIIIKAKIKISVFSPSNRNTCNTLK